MIRFFLILIFSGSLWAVEPSGPDSSAIHVDSAKGDDANDGRGAAVKTVARAIELAQPGDTIHLKPGVYYETADFSNKHGLPGKPITLDGHGAVLDGSEAVTTETWTEILKGVYRSDRLYERINNDILERWYLLMNGKMNRMYRNPKGPSDPLKLSRRLQKGEWTYTKSVDAFYLVLSSKESLDELGIRYPARRSGVFLSGSGSWLTIKNLSATHVYDDGFHVEGDQRNIVFENITAIECGDDGFSASDTAECQINGLVSIGNATGIYDTGLTQTHYKNILIKECLGYDLFFTGKDHSIENGLIESSAARAFWLEGRDYKDNGATELRLKNLKLIGDDVLTQELLIKIGGSLYAEHCNFIGLNVIVSPTARVAFQHCLVEKGDHRTEKPRIFIYSDGIWKGHENRYDIKVLQFGSNKFTAETFDQFQELTDSETGSLWADFEAN